MSKAAIENTSATTLESPHLRDAQGLLKGVSYIYKENGCVDWKKMINPAHLVFNVQLKSKIEERYQNSIENLRVEEVDDKYLLILLAGFKELAHIKGYDRVTYKVATAQPDYVAVSCRIAWKPTFETDFRPLVFESLADASLNSTTGFGRLYLMAMAENRAFVRCVRNSLGIHIAGKDEFDPEANPNVLEDRKRVLSPVEPHGILQNILKERKKDFSTFKEQWIALGHEYAKDWDNIQDVPAEEVFVILETIKKSKK